MNVMVLLAFYINLSEIWNDCLERRNPHALDRTAHRCDLFFFLMGLMEMQ